MWGKETNLKCPEKTKEKQPNDCHINLASEETGMAQEYTVKHNKRRLVHDGSTTLINKHHKNKFSEPLDYSSGITRTIDNVMQNMSALIVLFLGDGQECQTGNPGTYSIECLQDLPI